MLTEKLFLSGETCKACNLANRSTYQNEKPVNDFKDGALDDYP